MLRLFCQKQAIPSALAGQATHRIIKARVHFSLFSFHRFLASMRRGATRGYPHPVSLPAESVFKTWFDAKRMFAVGLSMDLFVL
jgi:hypothetical protein